ncbi:uncharacterized protein CELE_F14D7.9 [Caenorhabditis elegans]|uniref:Uncharacterized protein n=1 Tax=Caenorhabditis elegans TaxID=6239 RepID=Q7YX38_CAEEL|nr:Uncharacterized protein CELE_F14D7.9 [Caenorhabditis elegans]CAE17786.3 Uncharacterized protein CELE_F14D7.9 [Caenorhabditis elegans]|eukprot:NP_001023797.2 Uncharacterized protein CELE_F14D7.9 [Caenorhabditis elegans]
MVLIFRSDSKPNEFFSVVCPTSRCDPEELWNIRMSNTSVSFILHDVIHILDLFVQIECGRRILMKGLIKLGNFYIMVLFLCFTISVRVIFYILQPQCTLQTEILMQSTFGLKPLFTWITVAIFCPYL